MVIFDTILEPMKVAVAGMIDAPADELGQLPRRFEFPYEAPLAFLLAINVRQTSRFAHDLSADFERIAETILQEGGKARGVFAAPAELAEIHKLAANRGCAEFLLHDPWNRDAEMPVAQAAPRRGRYVRLLPPALCQRSDPFRANW
jgi:hypothetical protein